MTDTDRPTILTAGERRAGRSWLRRLLSGLGTSGRPARPTPPPRPSSPRLEPVRRSWAAAVWHARLSVRSGVLLDDYLRSRLGRYLAALAVPRTALPFAVEVDDGALVVRSVPEPRPAATPSGEEAWLAALVEAEGPSARQDLRDAEAEVARLDASLAAAQRRAEDVAHRLAADVAAGLVPAPDTVNALPEQLGRPRVRSGAPSAAATLFAVAALTAETWQVAVPLLAATGLDPADLGSEAARRPAELGCAAVFALGVATALFVFAHVALQRGIDLFRGEPDGRRSRWVAGAGAGAAGAAIVLAATMAALHPATRTATQRLTFALVLVAVPAAAAFLLRAARAESALRAEEEAGALEWDQGRARSLAERARRLEELRWADAEVEALSAARDRARRRVRELAAHAVLVARAVADAARSERAALSRVAQSLVGALELDRYEFIRQAAARGASELVATHRRRADPRPPLVAPAAPDAPAALAATR